MESFFVGLQAPDGSSRGVEVSQCKYYTTHTVTKDLFWREYKKSVSAEGFFILFTTSETCDFDLPKNSGIVDAGNWFAYFGPWANRLFLFHQIVVGHNPSLANEKKRKSYIYQEVVDGKHLSPKRIC
jgi:hypothetical protein